MSNSEDEMDGTTDIQAVSWTGGAHWHRRYRMPWSQNGVWGIRHAGWPNVKLRLHDKGGTLSHKRSVEPEIAFSWHEMEGMERVKVFALPFLGEGVRVTLKERIAGVPKRLIFYSWSRGRTMGILRFGEFEGVKVDRRAKNKLTVP